MKKIFRILIILLCCHTVILSQNAPVTTTGAVTNAMPGAPSVPVPVTVTGFNNIKEFTLTMIFNITQVQYVSAVTNPLLTNMTVTYIPPSGNSQGAIVFVWTGVSNVNLPDGSSLADLTFSYTTGTGMLTWAYTFGSVCQYKSNINGNLTLLNDTPKYLFYINGGISDHGAPVTSAPVIIATAPAPIALPVTVNAFNNITNLTLYLEYNPAVITYSNTFTKNSAFGSSFLVGDNAGSGGMRMIVIQWYGGSVTLANGATLCTLNFNYISSTGSSCALTWFDNGPSCEYVDNLYDILIDMPKATYYHNGIVTPPMVADFTANNFTPLKNTTVSFTDLSTQGPVNWTWNFNRPGVVYVNSTTSHSQNPQVQFTEGGLYTVTLVASNLYLSDSETKTGFIRAGSSGLWTGITSCVWETTTNWDNWLVPVSSVDVVIPDTAPNWPVYDTDFTIGVQCRSLTLSGTTSQMTINGELKIP